MADPRLAQLEAGLLRVPGVSSARVIGDAEPSEIHVVASPDRSPKQVVRDVQSLAAAGYGMPIDHRIVSVVQLADEVTMATPEPPPVPEEEPAIAVEPEAIHANGHRPVLDRVVLASKGDTGWVKVALRWPDGQTTEGAGAAGSSREARARGAVNALVQALQPVLEPIKSVVDIDQVIVQRLGPGDAVLVRAMFYERSSSTALVGSALVHDDVATAAVRAALHAVNRKLRSP